MVMLCLHEWKKSICYFSLKRITHFVFSLLYQIPITFFSFSFLGFPMGNKLMSILFIKPTPRIINNWRVIPLPSQDAFTSIELAPSFLFIHISKIRHSSFSPVHLRKHHSCKGFPNTFISILFMLFMNKDLK